MNTMQNYHDLLGQTLASGIVQHNARTGIDCNVSVGQQLTYDLRRAFPGLTTRKLPFKNIIGELIGFWRGYDSAAQFRAVGCNFWNANANETPAWLANRARKGRPDYLGRIYGCQWTDWKDRRIVDSIEERDYLLAAGYTIRMGGEHGVPAGGRTEWLMERSINQLEVALHKLLTDPSDRSILISAWRPDEFDGMALRPCHVDYRFVAFENPRELHLVMTMRSSDLYLGLPANIVSTSLFLMTMARLANFIPATVTIQMTNAHVYADHEDQTRELLTREHLAAPTVELLPAIAPITDLSQIPGVFTRIEPSHFELKNYHPHAALSAPMAA